MIAMSLEDAAVDPWFSQTKDYRTVICCFTDCAALTL
jgi:hypothetical protein